MCVQAANIGGLSECNAVLFVRLSGKNNKLIYLPNICLSALFQLLKQTSYTANSTYFLLYQDNIIESIYLQQQWQKHKQEIKL